MRNKTHLFAARCRTFRFPLCSVLSPQTGQGVPCVHLGEAKWWGLLKMHQLLPTSWLYGVLLLAIRCFKLLDALYREHIGADIIHELTYMQHFLDY